MLEPLHVAEIPMAIDLAERVEVIAAELSVDGDLLSAEDVVRLTRGPGNGGDSLHLVVIPRMEELNRLEGEIATESIDGAHVHDLAESDRWLVRAFMRGVHATRAGEADHPGLRTIARARSGRRLSCRTISGHDGCAHSDNAGQGSRGDDYLHRRSPCAAGVLPGSARLHSR